MAESLRTRFLRIGFNWVPCFRGTGAKVTYIADDYSEIRVMLPLGWRTRNYVGTLYGGSLYAAADPHYMILLIKALGPDYIVWDKAASIRFKKPGRGTLHARFVLDPRVVESIREELEHADSVDKVFEASWVDDKGVIHATVTKTVYVRKKAPKDSKAPT